MASEMIDRLARAICVACGDDPDAVGEAPHNFYPTLAHAFPRFWSYRPAARAALNAMREPTEAMKLAGASAAADQHYYKADAWSRCVQDEDRQDWLNGARYGWSAMIDAALAEDQNRSTSS